MSRATVPRLQPAYRKAQSASPAEARNWGGRRQPLLTEDEARFGRMVRIRRCWSPAPQRPVVNNGYEREFRYANGAISPLEGDMDWMICPVMNTEQMGAFLAQVSAVHEQDFIVMLVDGASSHVAKALVVPENIRMHRLPPYYQFPI